MWILVGQQKNRVIQTFCYFIYYCPWKISATFFYLAQYQIFGEVHFLLAQMNCPLFKSIALQEGHSVQNKQERGQRRDNPPLCPPYFLPSLTFSFPSSPATFICCPINNCYCSFNYAPVISKSGGHVSSPSQGSLGNYQHPSKGRCSCSSVAVAIITLLPLTSVPWARSPSGLSLSHHAFLCQAWPLTPPMAPQG